MRWIAGDGEQCLIERMAFMGDVRQNFQRQPASGETGSFGKSGHAEASSAAGSAGAGSLVKPQAPIKVNMSRGTGEVTVIASRL